MARGSIGLDERLDDYIVAAHRPEHPVLTKLRKRTAPLPLAIMQIGPAQGAFLAFLVRMTGAKNVLEIGTFTGYSALAMALALPPGGRIVACDVSKEWTDIGREHWEEAGVVDRIDLRLAPALETLAAMEGEGLRDHFDLVFIDALKSEYDDYYEACLRLVPVGALITFDNMLQEGDVADPGKSGGAVDAIRGVNAKIAKDDRVDAVLLPVGDGMTLARRVR
ncbi:class I SAM-dependent methyltransferase [Bauldia sp.]|uniref:class I SAM-dependent methyltransferase n=1 Tax=Bauldia sp. TaxID=2575872 RepID=UPI003BA85325